MVYRPRRTTYRRLRKVRRRKKAKWRQQKLAVGTVQKIARQIAKKEDKKNLRKYVHVSQVRDPSFLNWHETPSKLPVPTQWRQCTGLQCNSELLSDLGQKITDESMPGLNSTEKASLQLSIHGIQAYGCMCNNSEFPVRVDVRIIFIPNLNQFTDDVVDYMTPRFTMFHKTGQGINGITYRGYNSRALAASDATGVPVKFTTVARKILTLPGQSITGELTDGSSVSTVNLAVPLRYRRFALTKYFKHAKKAFVKGSQTYLSNGNYYLVWWSDGADVTQFYRFIASCNLQYSVKAPMHDDIAP